MTRLSLKNTLLVMNLFILVLCTTSFVTAFEKEVFQPPSLEGYVLDNAAYLDKDKIIDGIHETLGEVFKNSEGKVIVRLSTDRKTWAWGIFGNPSDRTDIINNYVIRDSNGDGIFDEKYPANEQFFLPDWVKGKMKK